MDTIDDPHPRFVVGVDFGTTFTKVIFAHSSSPNEVKLVQDWPNCNSDYVPSVIQYTEKPTRVKQWGYEVVNANSGSPVALKWFKLLLQDQLKATESHKPTQTVHSHLNGLTLSENRSNSSVFIPPTTTYANDTAHAIECLKISVVTVISDFLKLVLDLTKETIDRTYGEKFVRGSKMEYVLTVPAIWTDLAKDLMVKAAESAGFGTFRVDFKLIGEPESAAVYSLKKIKPNSLKKGDTFIVCDAGGGTVDLITYKIRQMEPLKLDEIVSGDGDLCGSVFLDQAFERYIRSVLGDKAINGMKSRSKHMMMKSWDETIKCEFGKNMNGGDEYVSVPGIRDNPDANVEDSAHAMESDAVQEMFDPVVDRIVNLVEQQVYGVQQKGEKVAAILLVGGFGSSHYLRKRLSDTHFGWRSTRIPVIQPVNARTAVVRGALLRGLDGSIVGDHRARRCYGSRSSLARPKDYAEYWDSKRNTWQNGYSDMEKNLKWDAETDTWRASGHLNWYIVKDDVVGDTHSVPIKFFRTVQIPADPSDFKFITPLFAYEGLGPPDFKWSKNPTGPLFKRVCTLRSDLSSIPREKFKTTTNARGESFYEVKYTLRVTLLDEILKFDSVVDGVVYGQEVARYE